MRYIIVLIVLAVWLWIDYLLAKEFDLTAQMKGHSERKYFWICFLLAIPGYLLVIALPDVADPAPAHTAEPEVTEVAKKPSIYDSYSAKPAGVGVRSNRQPTAEQWQCSCGRINPKYISSCSCGRSKYDGNL